MKLGNVSARGKKKFSRGGVIRSIRLLSFDETPIKAPSRYYEGNRRVRTDVTGVDIRDRGERGS